ncbi:MAG: F420-dependent methylenetetrahydromethanopterin dehydrogenase [Candidatus Bathyarchaeia archaeon]
MGFLKLGNIGSAPMIEFLLDERAEREGLKVRVVSSGAKLGVEEAVELTEALDAFNPELVILTSPNASLPGPLKAVEILSSKGCPATVVSDSPAKKALEKFEGLGVGYVIVEADSMIGARREFLDPAEMALFNADVIKVLAVTGVFNVIRDEMDRMIRDVVEKRKPTLPRLIIDSEKAVEAASFKNPYAKAKAITAFEMAKKVSDLTVKACFQIKEWERYTVLAAAAHELMRKAALIADEAREIEKSNDQLYRTPHADDGSILQKRRLVEKPS